MKQAVCVNCGSTNLGLQARCLLCGAVLQNLHSMQIEAETPTRVPTDGSRGTRYCLAVLNGPLFGTRFPLGDGVNIGVNPQNDIVLQDRLASRRHARIERQGNVYMLVDLGSTNGTYLNDLTKRISGPARLAVGNVITIGITRLRLEVAE